MLFTNRRAIFIALAALTGCAAAPVQMSSRFDAKEAHALLQSGTNIVRGSALVRQRGGGVVTCAGRPVLLVPATAYATERMNMAYGRTDRGYNPAFGGRQRLATTNAAEEKEYFSSMRTAVCDAQGFFKFENVANGTFYVATNIEWQVNPYFNEGGSVMQRVSLAGNEVREIVLTP